MKKNVLVYLVITAVLAALVVVLQIVGGIPVGPFTITLTLFPIVVGAVVLGPVPGLFLGLVFGVIVSILSLTGKDPGGQMVFAANPVMAWIACLLKGAAAGFIPGLASKLFEKHEKASRTITFGATGIILFLGGYFLSGLIAEKSSAVRIIIVALCAVIAALIGVGISKIPQTDKTRYYIASALAPICNTGIFVVFMLLFFRPVLESWAGGSDILFFAITGLVGVNFLIELTVAIILTPALIAISKYADKHVQKITWKDLRNK